MFGRSGAATNTYRVSDADVQAGKAFLLPKEDISSASPGGSVFDIPVRAVAVELIQDGVNPSFTERYSDERIVKATIVGVVDNPDITPDPDNNWTFDTNTQTVSSTMNEDTLLQMNFVTGTEDDDNSETFDFLIKNIPDGVLLTDSSVQELNLNVSSSENGKPIYSVSANVLSNIYIKPFEDFSGTITFDLIQTNTEPDGDSKSFPLTINVDVLPIVETDVNLYEHTFIRRRQNHYF